jgi:hypothetical protein
MKDSQQRQLNSLEWVQRFMHESAPDDPRFRSLRKEVDEVVARLNADKNRQYMATRSLSVDGKTIRLMAAELREKSLRPIAWRGKSLVRNQPKREEMLRVPSTRVKGEEMAAYALALAAWLKEFKTTFTGAGFKKDFLKQLRADAIALRRRSKNTGSAKRTRTITTKAIAQDLSRGYLLKSAIDALLQPYFKKDYELRIRWNLAKRIKKKTGRPKKRGRDKGTSS